jgi:hypothetical protein
LFGFAALGACSGGDGRAGSTIAPDMAPVEPTTTLPRPVAGGIVFPVAAEGEFDLTDLDPFEGTLRKSALGCWTIEWSGGVATAIFPNGSAAFGESELAAPGGVRLGDGEVVAGSGRLIDSLVGLPGGRTGEWASYVAFCASSKGALVIGELSAR